MKQHTQAAFDREIELWETLAGYGANELIQFHKNYFEYTGKLPQEEVVENDIYRNKYRSFCSIYHPWANGQHGCSGHNPPCHGCPAYAFTGQAYCRFPAYLAVEKIWFSLYHLMDFLTLQKSLNTTQVISEWRTACQKMVEFFKFLKLQAGQI